MTALNEHQRNTKDLTPRVKCQFCQTLAVTDFLGIFSPDDVDPEADVVAGGGDQPQPGREAGLVPGQEGGQGEAGVCPVLLSLAQAIHQHQGGGQGRGQRGQGGQDTAD